METSGKWLTSGRVRAVLGVLAAAALALFALQSSALIKWFGFGGLASVEHIRLGAYEGDVGALEWIAQEQGFFAQTGLAVDIKGYPSGKEASEALRAGEVDIATAAEFVLASRSFTEPDLRALASISYYRNKGIVARRDRGIAAPADLKGKRIGVTSPSGSEYALYVFLALHGLGVDDVTLVKLAPHEIIAAIAAGSIDAGITWQPHVQAMQAKLGADAVTFQGEGFDTYLLLLARQETLVHNRAAITKLLRALILAEDWARANPDEAKRFVARRFKLDAAYVDALWPGVALEVTLPQELLAAMDGEARWLAKRAAGRAGAIPNYAGFISAGELQAVKPSAVTLFSAAQALPPAAAAAR